MSSIQRILIANRGEIACRVIRSCKQLGIESISVFSDADRHAQHVMLADNARYIGPAPASESYLNSAAIIEAALKTKADAIHPGYGFLSESTELVRLCEENNIIFIGPSENVIKQMGSKINAKNIALELAIPTVPGYNGASQDSKDLLNEANKIGFPLLIKASAGGGGRGMRIVYSADDFEAALIQARQESLNAFSDDSILLEKYIVRSRHIEVQVFGDSQGNVCHFFDRECSIQRNYQKVIEEAPVSNLDEATRQKLFNCALKLASHLQYQGAGTVEFIVDADSKEFYFLEMNTRLQVEHPVTEMITGRDLVELQIRVAQGESLPFSQEDLAINGNAIEVRINAEDPANHYLGQTGTIELYREPRAEGLRVDTGIAEGSTIGSSYDSMLAKLVAWGGTREHAVQLLLQSLSDFTIAGVTNSIEFLTNLVSRPAFHQELTTAYIENEFPDGWVAKDDAVNIALAAAALAREQERKTEITFANTPWQKLGNWRLTTTAGAPAVTRFYLSREKSNSTIKLIGRNGCYQVFVVSNSNNENENDQDTQKFNVVISPGQSQWQAEIEGNRYSLDIIIQDTHVHLGTSHINSSYHFISLEEKLLNTSFTVDEASNAIYAHMPGLITDVLVSEGEEVQQGDITITMESMKLINSITAPCSGKVDKVFCAAGDNVESGTLLLEIEPIQS